MMSSLSVVEQLRQMQVTDLTRKETERSLPWKTSVQGILCATVPAEHWQRDVLYVLIDWNIARYRNVYVTWKGKQRLGRWHAGHVTGRQKYWRCMRLELAALRNEGEE